MPRKRCSTAAADEVRAIQALSKAGWSHDEIASVLKIGRATYFRRKEELDRLREELDQLVSASASSR